jgi:addiction module RelE/StbE family toxin
VREIALSTKFVKKLKKLTPEKFKMISLAMEKFQKGEDKTLRIHKLRGTFKNFWSFDADYDLRVIYSVNKNESIIIHILDNLGTHSELYGR